jgi:hypothetical protein
VKNLVKAHIDLVPRRIEQVLLGGRPGDVLKTTDGGFLQFLPEAFDTLTWDMEAIPGYTLPEAQA